MNLENVPIKIRVELLDMAEICQQCGYYRASKCGICDICAEINCDCDKAKGFAIRDGHTYHCASRMFWGDGECECNAAKKYSS